MLKTFPLVLQALELSLYVRLFVADVPLLVAKAHVACSISLGPVPLSSARQAHHTPQWIDVTQNRVGIQCTAPYLSYWKPAVNSQPHVCVVMFRVQTERKISKFLNHYDPKIDAIQAQSLLPTDRESSVTCSRPV